MWFTPGLMHLRRPGEGESKDTCLYEHETFSKITTIVDGIDTKNVNLEGLAQKLKTKFACGGTIKNGRIELPGRP